MQEINGKIKFEEKNKIYNIFGNLPLHFKTVIKLLYLFKYHYQYIEFTNITMYFILTFFKTYIVKNFFITCVFTC